MSGFQAASEMPQFIEGFEPEVDDRRGASAAAPDEQPLELPDVDSSEITLLTGRSLFESGFDALMPAAGDTDRAEPQPASASHSSAIAAWAAAEPAPSLLSTKAAFADQAHDAAGDAERALERMLKAVYTRWFDEFNFMKYRGQIQADIAELAHAAAAIATVDGALLLHGPAGEGFAAHARESVDETRDALMWRLMGLEPVLESPDVWPRIAELTPVISAGDTSVRLKCLAQALETSAQEVFHADMYFYYSQPIIDRIGALMAPARVT